jgi:hypothetical protein
MATTGTTLWITAEGTKAWRTSWEQGIKWSSQRERFTKTSAALCSTPSRTVGGTMGRQVAIVLYVLAMVAVVVGVDILFFRNQFIERLMANVGIVLVFVDFILGF